MNKTGGSSQSWHLAQMEKGKEGRGEVIILFNRRLRASQVVLVVKSSPANAGDARDVGLIPGLGRSPGERNGNPLQYSCLVNPMDRGVWRAIVHGVTKNQSRLT